MNQKWCTLPRNILLPQTKTGVLWLGMTGALCLGMGGVVWVGISSKFIRKLKTHERVKYEHHGLCFFE